MSDTRSSIKTSIPDNAVRPTGVALFRRGGLVVRLALHLPSYTRESCLRSESQVAPGQCAFFHTQESPMASVPTLTCPHCRYVFYGVKITRHGVMACGNCGKPVRV